MSEKTCSVCKYIVKSHEEVKDKENKVIQGERFGCRRYPPQTHFIMVLRGNALMGRPPQPVEEQRSAYPPVGPDWTCGEWAPVLAMTS